MFAAGGVKCRLWRQQSEPDTAGSAVVVAAAEVINERLFDGFVVGHEYVSDSAPTNEKWQTSSARFLA